MSLKIFTAENPENLTQTNGATLRMDDLRKHREALVQAAIQTVEEAMSVPCKNQRDFLIRAVTICKCREVVLGKAQYIGVQINNGTEHNKDVPKRPGRAGTE